MKTLLCNSLRHWLAAGLLLAAGAGAASPFTLRFGASGALNIPTTYDPADPDGELLMFQLGFRTGAADGLDVHDVPTPIVPPADGIPVLYFPASDPFVGGLSQDYRAPAESAVWELKLAGLSAGVSVTLQWFLVADGGSLDGHRLSLQDRNTGDILISDMTATTGAVFVDSDRSLVIVYGEANHPPVARPDQLAMLQAATTISVPIAQLLANDYDIDAGDTLTVVAVGAPFRDVEPGKEATSAYGTTELVAGGVTYRLPDEIPADWNGVVHFTYTIRDDNPLEPRETAATVELTVAPDVLAVPIPGQRLVHPGTSFTVTYELSYVDKPHSLALAFTMPHAGDEEDIAFWTFGGASSYADDDAATADPTITNDTGTGVLTLNFGTAVPASGTQLGFVINMPANGTDAVLPATASYRMTGAEPEPLTQAMPDLAVRAAYTVTFASLGNGTIAGTTSQLLEPGLLSTQVTANPAAGYAFLRWIVNGREIRDNPLTIAGGSGDMTVYAEFTDSLDAVDPDGEFNVTYFNDSKPGSRLIWDLTGRYAATVGDLALTLDLVHDERGALTGLGHLQGSVGTKSVAIDVDALRLTGIVRGSRGVVSAKITLSGANATTRVALKLALTLTDLRLTGVASGRITDTVGGKATIADTCVAERSDGGTMDGSYSLPVNLSLNQTRGTITGTGWLTLSNGRIIEMRIAGRRANGLASLRLVGDASIDPGFGAVKLRLIVETYASRNADIITLSGQAFGQSLKWPL